MDLENSSKVYAGTDETEEGFCIGRYVDSHYNTYYGWVNLSTKTVHIPRDSNEGPQVLDKNFAVLIHRFLHLLCICPPAPPDYPFEVKSDQHNN